MATKRKRKNTDEKVGTKTKKKRAIGNYTHKDKKRANNPPVVLAILGVPVLPVRDELGVGDFELHTVGFEFGNILVDSLFLQFEELVNVIEEGLVVLGEPVLGEDAGVALQRKDRFEGGRLAVSLGRS